MKVASRELAQPHATGVGLVRARARTRPPRPGTVLQYCILVVLLFLSFVPIVLMVSMSLRSSTLIYVNFWDPPWPIYTQNYSNALLNLLLPLARTLFVFAVSVIGILAFSLLAAYAFARFRFPAQGLLFYLVLLVMMIPGTILLVPHFIQANQFGLRDSLWGLAVFYVAGGQPFAIFLLRSFFLSQPAEMFEAARIDGASELRALRSIAIPLAWPIIMTLAIMNFLAIYNDLIWPKLMLTTRQNWTLIVALQVYNPGGGADLVSALPDIGGQAAGFVFASIPLAIVFLLGMRYFVQGLTSGAVKA